MMIKYQHVERLQMNPLPAEIDGLLDGTVQVFPKLDGANHCVWYDEDKNCVKCASRNMEQNEGWDSTGFYKYFTEHPELADMAEKNKGFVFYGEFLTPHTIRDYDEDAYGKWYVFDVLDTAHGVYLPYEFYQHVVGHFGVECIPPICTLENPTYKELEACVGKASYLHGSTPGEGIVAKNYSFRNRFGSAIWGKIVRDEFKVNSKSRNKGQKEVSFEDQVVEKFLTKQFVFKEAHKFVDEKGEPWNMKLMPELIPIIFKEFIRDFGVDLLLEYIDNSNNIISVDKVHKSVCRQAAWYMKRFMREDEEQ